LDFVRTQIDYIGKGAAQNNLNNEEISQIQIPVPSIDTQAEIIALFETACSSKKQKEAEAAALLASIDGYLLQELGITLPPLSDKKTYFLTRSSQVSGGRFDPFHHQNEFNFYKNPISKYPNKPMKDISLSIQTGLPVRNDFRIENGNYPYYGANGIIGYMDEFTHEGKYLVVAQDGYIGNHYVVDGKFWASNHNWVVKLDESIVAYEYVKNILDLWDYHYLVTGAVIPKLTKEALKSIKIPLPPPEKQTEIANHISALRTQAKQLQQQAAAELAQAKQHVEQLILGE
jgi:restriction endonuclease S subunit